MSRAIIIFKIKVSSLLIYILSFILFTVIGTISHEYGHIAVAKYLGYNTTLHYKSMSWDLQSDYNNIADIFNKYKYEIDNDLPYPRKDELKNLYSKLDKNPVLLVSIGGPLQTIITGTLGLIILIFRRKRIAEFGMIFFDWVWVFFSFFWLREIANFVVSLFMKIFNFRDTWFGTRGDEPKISNMLNLPVGTLSIILAFLGLLVVLYVIFKIIPLEKRFTFIMGGLIGGVSGYILWLDILGPIILP